MPHQSSSFLLLGGLLTGMAGGLLVVYSSAWGVRGYPKLATLFLLAGFALIAAGVLLIIIANH